MGARQKPVATDAPAHLQAQARRIRDLRATARVSQQEAASAIGVSIRSYADWEAARAAPSRSRNLPRIAKYYGTTPDHIEYGDRRASAVDRAGAARARIEQTLERIAQSSERIESMLKLVVRDQLKVDAIEDFLIQVQEAPAQTDDNGGQAPPAPRAVGDRDRRQGPPQGAD